MSAWYANARVQPVLDKQDSFLNNPCWLLIWPALPIIPLVPKLRVRVVEMLPEFEITIDCLGLVSIVIDMGDLA